MFNYQNRYKNKNDGCIFIMLLRITLNAKPNWKAKNPISRKCYIKNRINMQTQKRWKSKNAKRIHHKSVELKSTQPENPHEICVPYKSLFSFYNV